MLVKEVQFCYLYTIAFDESGMVSPSISSFMWITIECCFNEDCLTEKHVPNSTNQIRRGLI